MNAIFSGLKVIDITKVFSGPFATRLLADYGALVLKIENTTHGDDSRDYPPLKNGWSGYYEILNRNKKGISLDLKTTCGIEKLYTLCKEADVFVENLTPSTKHKLKIDYEVLQKINPSIVYASLSGVGQDTDKKYYDVIAQAESGLMSLSGTPQTPMKIGPSVVDAFSGMTLAFAIASALYWRQKTGIGQYIDVSMLGCSMNLLESSLIEYSLTKTNPERKGNTDAAISPFGAYQTKDGFIVIAVGNDALWQQFRIFLETSSEIDTSLFSTNILRIKNDSMLTQVIERSFSRYTVSELIPLLAAIHIPCSKVNSMSDVYNDSDNYSKGYVRKEQHPLLGECVVPGSSVRFLECPAVENHSSPKNGEHNAEYGV
jgi:CoA:oxalate CoA-transferase